ncbi:MAG: Type 1 glutamine amidotransferase-like domain-containing protein [Mycobacteriales bacterium]
MDGVVCLQGGGEFSVGCRPMDEALLAHVDGPVVVTALAGEVGRDYRTATANGVAHFRAVGATEVHAAPDVREEPAAALAVLRSARLLVLPGGSPSRLLQVLTTTAVGELVAELLGTGGAVMGASAGAMVLCPWTVLPDRRGSAGPAVARGLGVVPGVLVMPHWNGGSGRTDWLCAVREQVPDDVQVLGLPEESGVVVRGAALTAVGRRASTLVNDERELALGETWSLS